MVPIGRWVKKKDIEYSFKHGEVISYTLDGVSIHPVTTTIQVSQLTERKETAQSSVRVLAVIGEN